MDPLASYPKLRAYFDALTRLDLTAAADCFADDATQEDPVGGGVRQGRAAIHAFFQQVGGLLASFAIRPMRVYPCGSEVAVVWDATWRGKNGAEVECGGVDVAVIDARGMIASMRAFWDAAGTVAQLTR